MHGFSCHPLGMTVIIPLGPVTAVNVFGVRCAGGIVGLVLGGAVGAGGGARAAAATGTGGGAATSSMTTATIAATAV
ncbi:hypothetical protein GCM10029964_108290 [Kibdelosporangium lantanae]